MDDKDQVIENLRRELTETRRLLEEKDAGESPPQKDRIAPVRSESRFRQAVTFSPNPLLTLDAQGRMVFCNKACEDLIGYPLADVAGKDFGQLFLDGASAERVAKAVAKVFRGETLPGLELTVRYKDGGLRHTLSRAYPIYSSQHTVEECAIATSEKLKLARQALKDSEERYRALSDSSFEGIVISQDGIILDANENVVTVTGYSLSELIGMNVVELIAAEQRLEALKHLTSDSTNAHESIAVRKDGSRLPVEIRGKIIPYKGGTARVSTILDISESRIAEQALRANSQRLQAIFESVRDCIFVMDRDRKYVHVNPAMASLQGVGRRIHRTRAYPAHKR
jgi:PAS domain S-box-containing protein